MNLFSKLPIEGRTVYEVTLGRLARQKPFALHITEPYIRGFAFKKGAKICFGVEARELREILRVMHATFKRYPNVKTETSSAFSEHKKHMVDNFRDFQRNLFIRYTNPANRDDSLALAMKNYEQGIRSVAAIGLTLQFVPVVEDSGSSNADEPVEQVFLFDDSGDVD